MGIPVYSQKSWRRRWPGRWRSKHFCLNCCLHDPNPDKWQKMGSTHLGVKIRKWNLKFWSIFSYTFNINVCIVQDLLFQYFWWGLCHFYICKIYSYTHTHTHSMTHGRSCEEHGLTLSRSGFIKAVPLTLPFSVLTHEDIARNLWIESELRNV